MRTFKLLNSVKKTDNQVKIDRLIAQGYEEVIEVKEEIEEVIGEEPEVNLEELELAELKELADKREIEYAKNANKEKMLELLGE